MRANARTMAKRLARTFADNIGYTEDKDPIYVRQLLRRREWFYYQAQSRYGQLEFTPCVGLEIPALDALVRLASGFERGVYPTFGGQVLRFADLVANNLSEFVVSGFEDQPFEALLRQLEWIWQEAAEHFLERFRTSAGWISAARDFLASRERYALNVPTTGRVCLALVVSADGLDAGRGVLKRLAVLGPDGNPVQDYDEARKLYEFVLANPGLLDDLVCTIRGATT